MSGATERPRLAVDGGANVRRLAAALPSAHAYPWPGLEAALTADGRPLLLVGYGSLLNAASAARTIRPGADRRPVLAFGVRRVFNYIIPESVLRLLGGESDSRSRAALNAEPTGDLADALNGVCIEVPAADVPALRERERGYDLVPAACLAWPGDGEPFVGYILCAPSGGGHTDNDLLPEPAYARICREGAASFGKAFEAHYLATTWLADRRTTVGGWHAAEGER